jgi:hypothetical protein
MQILLSTPIKTVATATLVAVSTLLSMNLYAHAPELHKKDKAEKPKCEAMKNMDHSKMDRSDPIMIAMMKQCSFTADEHHSDKQKEEQDDHHNDKHDEHKIKKHHG